MKTYTLLDADSEKEVILLSDHLAAMKEKDEYNRKLLDENIDYQNENAAQRKEKDATIQEGCAVIQQGIVTVTNLEQQVSIKEFTIQELKDEIAEYEKVIKEVKLDSARIHEFSDRQAEEIERLNKALDNIYVAFQEAQYALCRSPNPIKQTNLTKTEVKG